MKTVNIIKSILASTALVVTTSWSAETITWVSPYGPGGEIDQVLQQVKPLLEKRGHRVEVKYLKSCAQALEILHKNEPNTVLSGNSNIFQPGKVGAQCQMDAATDGVVLFKGLNFNPFYLCTSPGKHIAIEDLSLGEKKVGVVAEESLLNYVKNLVKNLKVENNITVVPYRGGAQVVRAARAGDIDLWFGASQINVFNRDEITCFGSAVKNDPRGYPYLGNLVKSDRDIFEYPIINILWAKDGLITSDVQTSFDIALNSEEFQEFLKRTNRQPTTQDNTVLMKELLELNKNLNSLSSN